MKLLALLLVAASCSSDSPPKCPTSALPDCMQGFQHYYAVGCELVGSNGATVSEADAVNVCTQLTASKPNTGTCNEAINAWIGCLCGAPSTCDCSAQFKVALACM